MDSNVQNSEEEKSPANEHTIDNKHPEAMEQQIKNDQTYDKLPQGI
jgi:hypothetical protein